MIAQNNSWRDLQTGAKPKRAKLAAPPPRPARADPRRGGAAARRLRSARRKASALEAGGASRSAPERPDL